MKKLKQLKEFMEFASITNHPRWLCSINIHDFSSKKEKVNIKFQNKIAKLIKWYNEQPNDGLW